MEQIFKHYGTAILVAIVLIMLGVVLGIALQPEGYIAQEFQEAIVSFFDKMFALVPNGSQ